MIRVFTKNGLSVSELSKKKDKKYLHHLAFLGEVPPKIKDLKILNGAFVNMADGEETLTWTFDTDNKKKENNNMPDDKTKELSDQLKAKDDEITKLKSDIKALKDAQDKGDKKELSDQEKALKEKLDAFQSRFKNERINSLKEAVKGKVPKDAQAQVVQLADSLSTEQTIELSDNKGKISSLDLFIDIFKQMPLPVQPGLINMDDNSNNDVDFDKMMDKV